MSDASPRRQLPIRLIALVFAGVFGLLALGYFLFLRPNYVPVFSKLRQADAAAVVTQLEAKQIDYRLTDNGTTVLVPSDQADPARLAIAGSEVALKGGVGFELFNKSDMGLTDFAQRINYQRALQGELERTIMMMDEVETARVHLAMPERSLFRSERSPAKAAIELISKPGKQLDAERVVGVQRLVSFAVPDLASADVVVLDAEGHVLSPSSGGDAMLTPGAEEQQAVQRYYRARARAALELAFPGLQMDVKVVTLARDPAAPVAEPTPAPAPSASSSAAPAASGMPAAAPTPAPATAKPARDFRLRIVVATGAPINAEQTGIARTAVAAAVGLDEAAGDELSFQVGLGPVDGASPVATTGKPVAGGEPLPVAVGAAEPMGNWLYWLVGASMLVIAGLLLLPPLLAPSRRLHAAERDAMIERVREALRERDPANAG